MMAGINTSKAKLLLYSCKYYEDWCKMVRIWTKFTDLALARYRVSMFLLLEGEGLNAALELYEDKVSSKDRAKIIMTGLDKFYKKDDASSKF